MRAGRYIAAAFLVALLGLVVWGLIGGHASSDVPAGATTASYPDSTLGFARSAEPVAGPLPPSLAGLPLTASLVGERARAEVATLHGKALGAGIDQAWVGQYGPAAEATVWVTRSARQQDARELLQRMDERIAEGGSPFRVVGPILTEGVEGYQLDGMGQTHYYFLSGPDLYWLAAAPSQADAALADLVIASTRRAATTITTGVGDDQTGGGE